MSAFSAGLAGTVTSDRVVTPDGRAGADFLSLMTGRTTAGLLCALILVFKTGEAASTSGLVDSAAVFPLEVLVLAALVAGAPLAELVLEGLRSNLLSSGTAVRAGGSAARLSKSDACSEK